MGRIKTQLTKRVTHELLESHKGKFTGDFNENKAILKNIIYTPSKKLRNTIAGYISRLVKKEKSSK